MEFTKERFAQFVLGGDITGGAKGVSTASAVSEAIKNLYASVSWCENGRLKALDPEAKSRWIKEMDFLLAPCDHIVEVLPVGTIINEEMIIEPRSVPRSDIRENLSMLRQIDAMLLDILDRFKETEFSYAELKDEGWNLVPRIPQGGLSQKSRRQLQKSHKVARQIHKAAQWINESILAEMEVPETYLASLPKSGKQVLGNVVHWYMASTLDKHFSPEELFNYLRLSSEDEALEALDKMEAAMCIWRRKSASKSKPWWNPAAKYDALAERAKNMIMFMELMNPRSGMTSLETTKILHNKDVGKAALECYSRVLKQSASTVVSLVRDVLFEDQNIKGSQTLI